MLLILGPDRLLYRGPPVDGARHRHHALQLAMSLDAPLCLDVAGTVRQATGFIIDADTSHQLTGGGAQIALLYLEPESAIGSALRRTMRSVAQTWQPSQALRDAMTSDEGSELDTLSHRWLAELGLAATSTEALLDPRVADTLAHLAAHPGEPRNAATLAARVQLSPDRLMHLFAQDTGISLRSYVLWLKLKLAVRAALTGASLTEAAHTAGFADSAHLSHSFKAMFGLAPRFLFEPRAGLVVRFS